MRLNSELSTRVCSLSKTLGLLLLFCVPLTGWGDTEQTKPENTGQDGATTSRSFPASGYTCPGSNDQTQADKPCVALESNPKSFLSRFQHSTSASAALHYKLLRLLTKEDLLKLSEATKNLHPSGTK